VSICVRAGLPKPRPVPDTERIKDTKTLDYASTPLDANTVLAAVSFLSHMSPICLKDLTFASLIRTGHKVTSCPNFNIFLIPLT